MTIVIIILAYLLYLDDVINSLKGRNSNLLFSGALITILAWRLHYSFGILMCAISAALIIIALSKANK